MSRAAFLLLLSLALPAGGCAGLARFDRAAADLARQAPDCTYEPPVGVNNLGAKTCKVSKTLGSSIKTTSTTVATPAELRIEPVATP